MPSIQLSDLTFSHRDDSPIFTDVDLTIGSGWTGVVGANGAGKTTLLLLIAGELQPDNGDIDLPGDVVACSQVVDHLDQGICDLAGDWSSEAYALRGRLALDPDQLERWNTLSPGERKRWQVGAALVRAPEVLLLDEPTNHIDVETRDLLVAALQRYRGIGLIVSHDREVLNELCTRTARIHGGGVTVWSGPYDIAAREWQRAAAAAADEKERLRSEQQRLSRRADQQRRTLDTTMRSDQRALRQAGPRDSDARSTEAKGRRAAGAQAASQSLARTTARAQRVAAEAAGIWVDKDLGASIYVDYEHPGRRTLLEHDGPLIAGDATILDSVSVTVAREERVWLQGANGSGKTTLLRSLLSTSTLPAERILWLPQDQTEEERIASLAAIERLDHDARGATLNVVAALGVDPARVLGSPLPSPGEARKLTLAMGLAQHAWCLVLDEPTNHLDLPSIERLERALAAYPGALVLVTHDRRFGQALTDSRWVLADGDLRRW